MLWPVNLSILTWWKCSKIFHQVHIQLFSAFPTTPHPISSQDRSSIPVNSPESIAIGASLLNRKISRSPLTNLKFSKFFRWANKVSKLLPEYSRFPFSEEKPNDISDHLVGTSKCLNNEVKLG